jgi:hypothetical protein
MAASFLRINQSNELDIASQKGAVKGKGDMKGPPTATVSMPLVRKPMNSSEQQQ